MILDESEIQKLTRKERHDAQRRVLDYLGIRYSSRNDGSLVVYESEMMADLVGRPMPEEVQPVDIQKRTAHQRALKRLVILPLDQLRGLPQVEVNGCGVYFLWLGPALVYIGRSAQIARRVDRHRETKPFDRATWLEVVEQAADRYEREYVWRYHPPLNRTNHG